MHVNMAPPFPDETLSHKHEEGRMRGSWVYICCPNLLEDLLNSLREGHTTPTSSTTSCPPLFYAACCNDSMVIRVETWVVCAWQSTDAKSLERASSALRHLTHTGLITFLALMVSAAAVAGGRHHACTNQGTVKRLGSTAKGKNAKYTGMLSLTHTRELAVAPIGYPVAGTREFY